MILHDGDLLGDELLDISKKSRIVGITERNRHSLRSGATRPTDAMHIGFGYIRDVVVDHIFKIIDIDSAGGDIGRDKHSCRLFFEIGKRPLSVVLGFVSVNRFGDDSPSDEEFHHFVRSVLGSGKYKDIPNLRIMKEMDDEIVFISLVYMIYALIDRLGGGGNRSDFDFFGIPENGSRKCHNIGCHRRGKEECLSFHGDNFQELFNIVNKSHIEHTIGFVENEYLDVREGDIPLTHEIEKSPRSRYKDIDPLSEPFGLIPLFHSSEYDGLMQSGISTVRPKTLLDLDSKFPSRSDDEGFDFPF